MGTVFCKVHQPLWERRPFANCWCCHGTTFHRIQSTPRSVWENINLYHLCRTTAKFKILMQGLGFEPGRLSNVFMSKQWECVSFPFKLSAYNYIKVQFQGCILLRFWVGKWLKFFQITADCPVQICTFAHFSYAILGTTMRKNSGIQCRWRRPKSPSVFQSIISTEVQFKEMLVCCSKIDLRFQIWPNLLWEACLRQGWRPFGKCSTGSLTLTRTFLWHRVWCQKTQGRLKKTQ